jgi:hypothetical protein
MVCVKDIVPHFGALFIERVVIQDRAGQRVLCDIRPPAGLSVWSVQGFLKGNELLLSVSGKFWGPGDACLYSRRRPEYWWGVAWLPECWLTLLFGAGFLWCVWRDRKTLAAQPPNPTP